MRDPGVTVYIVAPVAQPVAVELRDRFSSPRVLSENEMSHELGS